MSKYLYLIGSELKENLGRYIFLWLELMIAIIALHLLCQEFAGYSEILQLYDSLHTENFICAETDRKILENDTDIDWVSENYEPVSLTSSNEDGIYMGIIYDKEQAEHIRYDVEGRWFNTAQETEVSQAVVTEEVGKKFRLGKTYTLNQDESAKISFQVVGILKNNIELFFPNSGEYDSLIGNCQGNEIWLYGDIKTKAYKNSDKKVLMAACKNGTLNNVMNRLRQSKEVQKAESFSDVWEKDSNMLKGNLVMPSLIGGVLILLTILHILSSELLRIKRKEYAFGIFFLYGATKFSCFCIQCMVDLFPVAAAFLMSELFLKAAEIRGRIENVPVSGFWLSLLICVGLTILTIRLNTKKLYHKSVVDMIKRRQCER